MRKQQNNDSSGSPVIKFLVLIVVIFVLITVLFDFQGELFHWSVKPKAWTGFGERSDKNSLIVTETGAGKTITKTITTDKLEPAKTLWDLISLSVTPATLTSLGFWFQNLQEKAKKKQAEQERERVADQQREEALQNYLNYLSELLVDKQLNKLLHSQQKKSDDEAVASATLTPSIDAEAALNVIKARTLSLLRLFDQDIPRKASVLSFLGDADLLKELKLDLSRSNWQNANLKDANLSFANLSFANLSFANLSFANLRHAVLVNANLSSVDLMGAELQDVTLHNADLSHADLSHTNLLRANLSSANLSDTDLRGVDLSCASLSNANLSNADLRFAKNLFPEEVKLSQNWEKAKYDEDFRTQLGLPPQPTK